MKIYTLPIGPLQANCYVLVDETTGKAAVFDAGGYNERLAALVENEDIKKVEYIFLTHGHFDHIMGVADLKEKTGAKVAIHELDAMCLEDTKYSLLPPEGYGEQKFTKADVLLHDGDVINVGSLEIKVMHTPGHTPGGVCYICGDVMFSGDTLFCRTIGRTDLDGGNPVDMDASCHRLAALEEDYTVFPGHNRSTTLSEEKVKNRYLRKIK